jgi:hypothetical protein
MKVFYRISDASNTFKVKLSHATKQHCLKNFLKHFPRDVINIYANNVHPETLRWLDTTGCVIYETNSAGNAASFLDVLNEAMQLPDDELVYLVEDDYLHLENSYRILLEGLQIADYVSLYDHPDKYISVEQGGNPLIDSDGGEYTKVYLTHSSHWKLTNSTTLTFASRVLTLKEDYNIWKTHSGGQVPDDYRAFLELRSKGRSLITPIPGYSTHCEIKWTTPLIDWSTI